jgi:hypothetical protein
MDKSVDKRRRAGQRLAARPKTASERRDLRKLRVTAAEWTSILVSRTSWLLDAELRGLDQRCLSTPCRHTQA